MNAVIAEGGLTLFDTTFSASQENGFVFANLSASTSHAATMETWLRPDARG